MNNLGAIVKELKPKNIYNNGNNDKDDGSDRKFNSASRTYLALFCSSITLVGISKMNLCVRKNLSSRYWNQRIFIMMEIITRTIEVTERINGSLLFFSLLVFCAT